MSDNVSVVLKADFVAPYLPYGLKFKSDSEILELIGVQGNSILLNNNSNIISSMIDELYWKPMLRPLSQLTEEIEINGEMIVPIKKLHSIAKGSLGTGFSKQEFVKTWTGALLLKTYRCENYYTEFIFSNRSFHYRYFDMEEMRCGENHINNQLLLFHTLFKWHFDVFELIDKGLAISIDKDFGKKLT